MIPEAKDLDQDAAEILKTLDEKVGSLEEDLETCKLQSAANTVINISRIGNQYLNEKEPWKLVKTDRKKAENVFSVAAQLVKALAVVSAPFIPFAAEEIWKTLNLPGSVHEQKWDNAMAPLPQNHKIAKAQPLFKKIDESPQELQEKLEKIREK
jgi:methionyl-tRNA synthetase